MVVIIIAPFDASEPYKAAAAAPLRTVIDSISSGLKSLPRDEKSKERLAYTSALAKPDAALNEELFIGIPSTTYNGWLFPEIDVRLLNVTVVEAPGAPPLETTSIPETLPCKAVMKLSRPESMMSAALTFCTDEPTDRATRFIPNSAVISTSPSMEKKVGDFNLGLLAGATVEDTKRINQQHWGYNPYTNSVVSFAVIENSDKFFTESNTRKRMVGLYGEFRAAYKSIAYLTITGRNDWSSTLPIKNRSYFYPSVSGSFAFTELLPANNILTFGKIRASWAQVGKDADPYMVLYVIPDKLE